MKTPFQRAQESWEQSWVNGPPESPVDSYIESLADKSLSELQDEKATLVLQEPECDEDTPHPTRRLRAAWNQWQTAMEALDDEIASREDAVTQAFQALPLHHLLTFSTSCPLEQEILDEVRAERLEEEGIL